MRAKTPPPRTKHTYLYSMYGTAKEPINPFPLDVEANDLGHALQKIAASLSDYAVEVKIWKRKRFDDRSKS